MPPTRRTTIERDAHQRLELPRVLEHVASYAASAPGRVAVRTLTPAVDPDAIRRRLDEVSEILLWRKDGGDLRLRDLIDVRPLLEPTDKVDRVFEGEELAGIAFLIDRSHALGSLFRDLPDHFPRLKARGAVMTDLPTLRKRLEISIDRQGSMLDSASPALAEARRQVERLEEDLRRWMERRRDHKDLRRALQGAVISQRNGRWVFAVRAEYRRSVPGVVHDRSSSGATLFIEPEEIVLRGNELSDLRAKVRRETHRILVELTQEARRLAEPILGRFDQVIALEIGAAAARFGETVGAVVPEIIEGRQLRLKQARHPILLAREGEPEVAGGPFQREKAEAAIVPLDLELSGGTFQLVVTGPNTGGKTVVLKTIGLAALLAYCGIPVPAETAEVPIFDAVFADIGDEQSIEQNLSTFSSHVTVLAAMAKRVSSRSLVLIDELGAGTDPLEGAALAEAILEDLYRRGAFTVVTTHLGRLKEYAYRHRKCENASMEFDPVQLGPTYRLRTGLAGESNALIIAERLGIPKGVVERARELQSGEDKLDPELIAGIERPRNDLERRTREMERLQKSARRWEESAEEEHREILERQKAVDFEAEAAEEERVRTLVDRLEKALRSLGPPPKERREAWDALFAAIDEARRGTRLAERRLAVARALKKGDSVFVPKLDGVFEVRKINKSKELLTVDARGVLAEVSFQEISWVQPDQLPAGDDTL